VHGGLNVTAGCPGFPGRLVLLSLAAAIAIGGCGRKSEPSQGTQTKPAKPAAVDAARLEAADSDAGNWMSHGRTYDEQRFSPLKQIDTRNVRDLKLAWHYDIPTDARGQ
jgi:quinohemoprotein ethanol dehydrogenase